MRWVIRVGALVRLPLGVLFTLFFAGAALLFVVVDPRRLPAVGKEVKRVWWWVANPTAEGVM